jgi:hypothetical protein
MYCPNCNQEYDGKFCPECGTKLIENPVSSGVALNLSGDANAISGGIHMADSHNVHNEDRSVHTITNTTSTVNNITQVAAQKSEMELLQEKKAIYLTECKRAYEDNVLEQSEVVLLEECRIKLGLDKATADAILESVRVMSERNARKSDLNPIARTKLKILTDNLRKNEVKALMDQIDSLEPLVRKYEHDELARKFFLVLAALKSDKCIELKENSKIDSYWKSYWSYLAYIKNGRITDAENVLISLDRFTNYPEDNMSVLAVAGALMTGNKAEAKEYLDAVTGEFTPALQRFVDSIYLLLEPDIAKEMGADEDTCAFYLVNFFGQKDAKAKAEEERLKREAADAERKREEKEEQKRKEEEARKKAEEEQRRKEAEAAERRRIEAEQKRKAEEAARKKAEVERKKKEAAEKKRKAEEAARKKAEEERKRKAEEEARKPKCSGTTRDYEDHAKGLPTITKHINENWNGHAREACILENGMAVVMKNYNDYIHVGIDKNDLGAGMMLFGNVLMGIVSHSDGNESIRHFTFNSQGIGCVIYDKELLGDDNLWPPGGGMLPEAMQKCLEEYTSRGDVIGSVAIAENDNWAVVSNKGFAGTNRAVNAAKKAGELYGDQKSIALTTLGIIVCCERGVYYENIPTNVAEGIKNCLNAGWIPAHVSFTDSGTYFISNGKAGNDNKCSFYM